LEASRTINTTSEDFATAITCTPSRKNPSATLLAHHQKPIFKQDANTAESTRMIRLRLNKLHRGISSAKALSNHVIDDSLICKYVKALHQLRVLCTYLPPTTFSFRSAFDDPGKIQKLNLGIIVVDDARNASQRRKLIRSSF
jgi:hypothetical protein